MNWLRSIASAVLVLALAVSVSLAAVAGQCAEYASAPAAPCCGTNDCVAGGDWPDPDGGAADADCTVACPAGAALLTAASADAQADAARRLEPAHSAVARRSSPPEPYPPKRLAA